MEALRAALHPWLGKPQWKQTEGRSPFVYRFNFEDMPPIPLRLKVEINSREHFAMFGSRKYPSPSSHAGSRAAADSPL